MILTKKMEKKSNLFSNEIKDLSAAFFKKMVDKQIDKAHKLYKINRDEIILALMKANKRHFVYLLEKNNQVIYVGRSSNLYSRLMSHKSNKDFDSIKLIEYIDRSQMVDAEFYFIKYHNPVLNKLWVTYG
jgi:hypothetical protein